MLSSPSYRVRLLGPVDVLVNGRPVAPDRLQIRRLVALVGARPGFTTSLDELVDQLWPSEMPKNPEATVRGYISRIPKGRNMRPVVTRSHSGYRIEPELIDAWHFQELLGTAERLSDPGERVSTLLEVRDLWRGRPFGDANDRELLSGPAASLEDSYLLATCLLAESLIELGESGRAAVVLRDDFAKSPDRERVGALLAHSLAQEGRQREAIAVLERMRQAVLDVGLRLSEATNELERAILNSEIDLREKVWHAQPSPGLPFVGRAEMLDLLVETCRRSENAIVVGEAGLGKSALIERLSAELRGSKQQMLMLRIDPDPTQPLAFLVELVDELLAAGAEPQTPGERSAVQRLIPSAVLDESLPSLNRAMFADHLVEFIVRSTAENVVLAFDDLQFLDPFSASIVADLLEAPSTCIVATCRSIPDALGEVGNRTSVEKLGPLTRDEIASYVSQRLTTRLGATYASELLDRTGGNPLFLRLLVDLDVEGSDVQHELSASVVLAVRSRLTPLSGRAKDTLQSAAAIGVSFPLDTLTELRPGWEDDLAEAVDEQLISIDPANRRGQFLHGLVRDAVYEMIPEGLRAETHDRIGSCSVRLGVPPAGYSSHFVAAATLDPVRAVRSCLAAASADADQHAFESGSLRLHEADRIVAEFGLAGTEIAAEVLLALGRLQRLVADPNHVATLLRAASLAEEIEADELFALAVVELISHGGTTRAGHSVDDMLQLLDAALLLPLSSATRAMLSASASPLTAFTRHYKKGQELFRSAMATIDEIGDPALEGRVLAHAHLGLSNPHPEVFARRSEVATRLAAVAGSDVDLQWEAAYLSFWHNLLHAYPDGLQAAISKLRELTPGAQHRKLSLLHIEVAYAQVCGDFATAEAQLEMAKTAARSTFSESWAVAHHSSLLISIRDGQDRLSEVSNEVEAFVLAVPDFPNWKPALAISAVKSGDLERAQAILSELAATNFEDLFQDLTWTAAVSGLGRVASTLNDVEASQVLYELLRPHERLMSWAGTCSFGPNDRALGLLAETLGDEAAAARHMRIADAMEQRLRALAA